MAGEALITIPTHIMVVIITMAIMTTIRDITDMDTVEGIITALLTGLHIIQVADDTASITTAVCRTDPRMVTAVESQVPVRVESLMPWATTSDTEAEVAIRMQE